MSASIVRSARSTACFQPPNIHKCTAVAGSTEVSTAVSTAVHSSHWQRAHAAPENHVWNHIRRKKESECPASSPCHVPPLLCSGPVVVRDDDSHSEACARTMPVSGTSQQLGQQLGQACRRDQSTWPRRTCADHGSWRWRDAPLTCPQRYRWHLEKNATQMPAIS